MVKLRASNSIGGLVIHLYYDETKQHGNGDVTVRAPKDGVSELAIAAIREAGTDATEELIEVCRSLILAVDEATAEAGGSWRDLTDDKQRELFAQEYELVRDDVREIAIERLDGLTLRAIAEQQILMDQDGDPTDEQIDQWIKENLKEKPGEA